MQEALLAQVPNYCLPIRAAGCRLCSYMDHGRLIRVRKQNGDSGAGAYIVALPDSGKAIALIKNKVAAHGDTVEDLGRVSDALLIAMKLQPGSFTRA